jgi:hypothetical protein
LITNEVAVAAKALADVRHRLAHGGEDAVTDEEFQTLRNAFDPLIGDDIDLDEWSEEDQLRIIVAGIWQSTGFTVEYALEKRAEAEAALAAWRKRGALSAEQIRELLKNDGDAIPAIDEEIPAAETPPNPSPRSRFSRDKFRAWMEKGRDRQSAEGGGSEQRRRRARRRDSRLITSLGSGAFQGSSGSAPSKKIGEAH